MARGLGKGLEGLFEDNLVEDIQQSGEFRKVRTSDVEPNREQPRKIFDREAIEELSASIAEHGILQPITTRKLPNGRYQIISGERRWRAARMAGIKEVPIIVKEDVDDRQALELGLIENLQREDLNAVEEARGYKTLAETFGMTQDQIAARVGKSRSAVANAMRILALPQEVLDMVLSGELSSGHARALLPLMDKAESKQAFIDAAKRAAEKGLTVRKLEQMAAEPTPQTRGKNKNETAIYYREAENKLSEALGRKVTIKTDSGKQGKGKIIIEFYDTQDFNALNDTMLKNTK